MSKWDSLNDMLKEYFLEEFSTVIYTKRKQVEETTTMKQIILETAQEWIQNRPYEGREIMAQIIETITVDNVIK